MFRIVALLFLLLGHGFSKHVHGSHPKEPNQKPNLKHTRNPAQNQDMRSKLQDFGLPADVARSPSKLPPPRNMSQANTVIAFSAELSQNTEMIGGVTIVFDRQLANAGEFYFPNSGQFLCPDNDLYVFVWSIRKSDMNGAVAGMRCIAKLRHRGVDQKSGPKTSYYSTSYSGVAEMIGLVQCSSSPLTAVSVSTIPWSQGIGSTAMYEAKDTSFSGFKLPTQLAFSVELVQRQYHTPDSRLRFNRILHNIGGHYDNVNDRFRCPDDGVYVFSISTHTADPATPWSVSRLMMENAVVMQGPITYIATQSYDSGSASSTAVLQCTEGFSVYVEAQASHTFQRTSYEPELTSFTGFKLFDAPGSVAFCAVTRSNQSVLFADQIIIFNNVITNIGNAYDGDLSQFVCPDEDYYLFTVSATANSGGAYLDLYMDGTLIKALYLTSQEISSDLFGTSGSSSITIIKQCVMGSKVMIRGRNVSGGRVYLAGYTSFSGYKIPR